MTLLQSRTSGASFLAEQHQELCAILAARCTQSPNESSSLSAPSVTMPSHPYHDHHFDFFEATTSRDTPLPFQERESALFRSTIMPRGTIEIDNPRKKLEKLELELERYTYDEALANFKVSDYV